MENKRLNNYLKRTLGEHYSYMPKGELKVNSSKGIVEFTFNPAKVSKRFIEACLDKDELYKYIKESTGKKVVMQFPLDESRESKWTKDDIETVNKIISILEKGGDITSYTDTIHKLYKKSDLSSLTDDEIEERNNLLKTLISKENESMMTPTASMFTGKRTLQCDKDGKEVLREDVEEDDEEEELELNIDEEEEIDEPEEDIDSQFAELARKTVYDAGGFMTDYTLYLDRKSDRYICIFGDQDFYRPGETTPDAEFEKREDAEEWFSVYDGVTESEEDEEDFSDYEEDEEELELNTDGEESEDEELELRTNEEDEEVEEESLQLKEDSDNPPNKDATDVVVDVLRLFPDVNFVDQRDLGNGKIKLIFNHELTPSKLKALKSWLDNEELDYNLSKVALTIVAPWKSQMVGKLESLKRLNLKESLEEIPYEGWTIKPFEITSIEYGEDKYPGFTHYMIQRDRDGAYLSDKSMKSVLRGLKLDGDTTACNTVDKAKKVIDYINSLKFLDEDYWFGGNGKMEIPERDNLQPGDQELEIRTDDVTKDNEDQNEEEQEEELNEDINSTSSMTATEVVDDLENKFSVYYKGGTPGGFGLFDKSKVLVHFYLRSFMDTQIDSYNKFINSIKSYLDSNGLKYKIDENRNTLSVEAEKDNLKLRPMDLNEDYLPTEFYRTIFELVDGSPDEEYEWRSEEEAKAHMNLFDESDADLYKRIYVEDPSGKVIDEKRFVSEGLNEKISETDRLKYSVELIRDDGTSDVHSFANYKSAKNLYDQYDETDGYIKVRLIGNKGMWDTLEEKDFTSVEPINEEKKVSFKDVHKCDVCGKPLSQCTCEVKEEEDLKEGVDTETVDGFTVKELESLAESSREMLDYLEDK